MDALTSVVSSGIDVVNQPFPSQLLKLFVLVYGGLAAPKLPLSVSKWFSNTWFRVGFMALIAWNANRDPAMAIVLAAVYCLSLHYATQNAITQVATTGEITPEVTVVVSGGSGLSIKPASAVTMEEVQMKTAVANGTFNPSISVVRAAQEEAKNIVVGAPLSSQTAQVPSTQQSSQTSTSQETSSYKVTPEAMLVPSSLLGSTATAQPVLAKEPAGIPITETALTAPAETSVPVAYQSTSQAVMAEVPSSVASQ